MRKFLLTAAGALLLLAPLQAQVVISQVYGGGGNSGAPYQNDFVELFNAGASAQSLLGWSVQYTSATGTGTFSSGKTNLSGSIGAGKYYLVQLASQAAVGAPLPIADATGTVNMSASAGKVVLASTSVGLNCNGSTASPCTGTDLGSIVDLVGYGTANYFEGTGPAPGLSNTTAGVRAGGGCTDTNNNSTDFTAAAPNPRNSTSSANPCSGLPLSITNSSPLPAGTVNQPYSVTFAASGGSGSGYVFSQPSGTVPPGLTLTGAVLSGTPTTVTGSPFTFTIHVADNASNTAQASFQITINPVPTCTPTNTIAQIQGSGNTSPLVNATVTTSGIVTALKSNGFFLQMPAPGDGDPNTSDGVFVFTSSAPTAAAAVGNSVCVTGKVAEFIPSSDLTSPSQTEISNITAVFAISTGNALPVPIVLTAADTNPAGALLQLEKYEGMRVQVNSLTTVAPTRGTIDEPSATSTSAGIFYGVLPGIARPFREPGVELPDPLPPGSPCCVTRWDTNPEILSINSLGQPGSVAIDVTTGQTISNIIGPIEFSQRAFTIDPDPSTPPTVSGSPMTFVAVPQAAATELTVDSFNMERFFDTVNDPSTDDVALTATAFANRLNKASLAIRNVLRYPDILGVEEMENITTLQAVAAKVNNDALTAGDPNPNYQPYLVEGNDIGGIDVGLLIKTPKVTVVSVTQFGKDTTYFDPVANASAILNDRPPLVLRATVALAGSAGTLPVTVIVNHLRSLSGVDDPADGPRVRAKREAQAEYLANLIQGFYNSDPTANIVSIGDYNAFQFSDGYADVVGVVKGTPVPANQVVTPPAVITNPALIDLVDTLPPSGQYSYSFNGSAQELDHILLNPNMASRLTRYAVAHNDADFPETYRNDPNRPERISDHDMPVAYFTLYPTEPALGFALTGRVGPQNARTWSFTWTNNGPGTVYGVKMTGLTLQQTAGAACTPVINPAQFPISGGDLTQSSTAAAQVLIDFTGCPFNSRFKVTAPFTANNGAIQGTQTIASQIP